MSASADPQPIELENSMKQYFNESITTLDQAYSFFAQLHSDGLLFHPDDHPETVVCGSGFRLFTDTEAAALTLRIAEVYAVDPDPCKYILTNLNEKDLT